MGPRIKFEPKRRKVEKKNMISQVKWRRCGNRTVMGSLDKLFGSKGIEVKWRMF